MIEAIRVGLSAVRRTCAGTHAASCARSAVAPPPRDPAPDLSLRAAHPSRSSPQASAPHPSTKPSFAPRRSLRLLLAAAMLPALGQAQTGGVSVPLMLAPDSERQGFVRIINETDQAGSVRITAVDDAGTATDPIEIRLEANQSLHFNSDDLANGNAAKDINRVGLPRQGHWRLAIETALEDVHVQAFVRTRAGFLTAMHDVLPRDDQGRLVARMLNPGSNSNQASSLRLVNAGANAERVSIAGIDDHGGNAGPVTLTLAAGQSRTISAFDLENGAQGLTGSLGDGAGKWRLLVTAGQSIVGVGLLETPIGPITNISTAGVPAMAMTPTQPGGQGNSFADAFNLAIDGRISGEIDPAGESDYYRIRVSESGYLTAYTRGNLDTRGYLYDSGERQLASNDDGGASDGTNFRIEREVDVGTYYVRVEAYYRSATGSYTIHAGFAQEPDDPNADPIDDIDIGIPGHCGLEVDVCVRDYSCEDGDLARITVNNRDVFAEVELFNDWNCRTVAVDEGANRIAFHALNGSGNKCGNNCSFSCTPGAPAPNRNTGELRIIGRGGDANTQRWLHAWRPRFGGKLEYHR